MEIKEIAPDNVDLFSALMPPDAAKNACRDGRRGLVAFDPSLFQVGCGLTWAIVDREDEDKETRGELEWFCAFDADIAQEVLCLMEERVRMEGGKSISLEAADLSEEERVTLENSGYALERRESRDVVVTVGDLSGLGLSRKTPKDYVFPVKRMTPRQFKSSVLNCLFHGKTGFLTNILR